MSAQKYRKLNDGELQKCKRYMEEHTAYAETLRHWEAFSETAAYQVYQTLNDTLRDTPVILGWGYHAERSCHIVAAVWIGDIVSTIRGYPRESDGPNRPQILEQLNAVIEHCQQVFDAAGIITTWETGDNGDPALIIMGISRNRTLM